MTGVAIILIGGGVYLLSLVGAPVLMPYIAAKPINPETLEKPAVGDNRVIIPKIGVDIAYGAGESSLNTGAWWRFPERGNPEIGGNFILAAHRFEIQPTPMATWEKSPFYRIDKLNVSDEIIIDYNGKRYGYKVDEILSVTPDRVEIEAPSEEAKLTLYSCTLGGARDGRVVIVAKPLGEVVVQPESTS